MNDYLPSVEDIVHRYFVRYERLMGAIPYAFGPDLKDLNIYVDLYGMYRTIYSRSYRTTVNDYVSFTSTIVSMCSHYRTFFKRVGIRTKIFLISSFNTPENVKSVIPEYNKTMDDKRQNKVIGEMMDLNQKLLSVLCPYLPDIFYLTTDFESSVLMYEIMNREGDVPSMIISTDLYPLQLCTLKNNTALLYPRWLKGPEGTDDISPICPPIGHPEHEKSFAYIIQRENGKTTSETVKGAVIPSNFMLLEALNKFKNRDLPVIFNVSTASKIINQTPGGITNRLFPTDIANTLIEKGGQEIFTKVQDRFRALDVVYQHNLFLLSTENLSLHYENLSDPDALNLINSKYFSNNPLDLMRL